MSKGIRISEEELEKRYLTLRTLRAQTKNEFNKLIKTLKDDKTKLLGKLSYMSQMTKDEIVNQANNINRQRVMIDKNKKYTEKTEEGWKCKKCKDKKFSNLAGINIHIGKYHKTFGK